MPPRVALPAVRNRVSGCSNYMVDQVELSGLEPLTSCMPSGGSTSTRVHPCRSPSSRVPHVPPRPGELLYFRAVLRSPSFGSRSRPADPPEGPGFLTPGYCPTAVLPSPYGCPQEALHLPAPRPGRGNRRRRRARRDELQLLARGHRPQGIHHPGRPGCRSPVRGRARRLHPRRTRRRRPVGRRGHERASRTGTSTRRRSA